jgi:ferric-dicitrate binding protein FerR (iron transport regulator)
MKEQDIYIEQLMMERLAGIISKTEAAYLDELIKNNEATRAKWVALQAKYEDAGSQQYLETLDADNALFRLRQGVAQEKRPAKVFAYWMKIAAAILIPLLFAGTFFFRKKTPLPNAVVNIEAPDRSVKLYVGGQRVLSLSQNRQASDTAGLRNVKLNIGNGSLSYIPLTAQADNSLNTLVIPQTQTYRLTLSDGTDVWLNSESQLKFPFSFSSDKREVWVSGEAYFKVTRNPRQPFIVHTSAYDVQVLGTEFNVNTYDSLHGRTALVTGAVNTRTASGQSISLKPGYQAVLADGNAFRLQTFDSNNELSWMKGIYYFQNTLLQDIATVVRRWYGVTLVFDSPVIPGSRFTGALRKDRPLNEFLDNLSVTSGITYLPENGIIHLKVR